MVAEASTRNEHAKVPDAPAAAAVHLVVGGHVDHGKSTVVGRLLADTGSLPVGKLDRVRAHCAKTERAFEYAFLLDALKDEQAQGITIDVARVFFKARGRPYVILDAPGHVEFLKNMVTGAAHADAALVVIDAREGVRENSRRHGYMMAMLGVRRLAVVVNKMDLVGYDEAAFDRIVADYGDFLRRAGADPACFVPTCAREGENIAVRALTMPWYAGPTVLELLDRFTPATRPVDAPFRMPVQDVYKFTRFGDDRRIVAGTVASGRVAVGDEIAFLPSGKKGRIKSIERFAAPAPTEARAGSATGLVLHESIYVGRGEIAVKPSEAAPCISTRLRASLFWLGKRALDTTHPYVLKLGTARVPMCVEAVHRVIDASRLDARDGATRVERHEVAECTLKLERALAFDVAGDFETTSRFVIVDDHDVCGGGIVREALPDAQQWARDKALVRNTKWEPSAISAERRSERYGQRPMLVLVSGEKVRRKVIAREIEARLFDDGRVVYFMGMGNLLYGVDADLERQPRDRHEHLRRLAETANLMLDAGLVLVVSLADLTRRDLEILEAAVPADRIVLVWVGDPAATDARVDVYVPDAEADRDAAHRIKSVLQDAGALFRGWR
jgi:bifunctional enzyme CysN/CysC